MKLTSSSFQHDQPIPEQFAFGAPDRHLHVRLAANHNPQLAWTGAPAPTRSFALICVDVDAPTRPDDVNQEGRVVPSNLPRADFYHWIMVDIPPATSEIAAGECSDGIVAGGKKRLHGPQGSRQGVNDYTSWFANDPDMAGTYRGYDGPCPPWNDMRRHRYHFTLYALSCERAPVEGDFTGPQTLEAIRPFVLAEARITGTYAINPEVG
ncbi:phospholipid-binding protein [Steroidobacter denitrificans]|uniref:Phospholipid-binding protein n=1 Tax=Steroidobacter denitrificans TaxID=465721 RepID=A0A127F5Q5_STEDE|nr:YbhB/YbcL family Raf kinase inhibitor-like protein [Steroidobacter denitrificans]AMN45776.1 phospholipid-binding protein [Steroidobacter denitrificans]